MDASSSVMGNCKKSIEKFTCTYVQRPGVPWPSVGAPGHSERPSFACAMSVLGKTLGPGLFWNECSSANRLLGHGQDTACPGEEHMLRSSKPVVESSLNGVVCLSLLFHFTTQSCIVQSWPRGLFPLSTGDTYNHMLARSRKEPPPSLRLHVVTQTMDSRTLSRRRYKVQDEGPTRQTPVELHDRTWWIPEKTDSIGAIF
jgi:hypothetical protein